MKPVLTLVVFEYHGLQYGRKWREQGGTIEWFLMYGYSIVPQKKVQDGLFAELESAYQDWFSEDEQAEVQS